MRKLILLILAFILISSVNAYTYYVCTNGSDVNNGSNINLPKKTITGVNTISPNPGDNIMFCRGSTWRAYDDAILSIKSGTAAGNITYGAYNAGNKPIIDGSIVLTSTVNWTNSSNIWNTTGSGISQDVFCYFNNENGTKEDVYTDLNSYLEFFYSTTNDRVSVYYTGNLTKDFSDIRCGIEHDDGLIDIQDEHYVTIENLNLKYDGGFGIQGSNTNYITVQYMEMDKIGGTYQTGTTQYGNCIEFYANSSYSTVRYNNLSDCFDAGISHQLSSSSGAGNISHVRVYGNLINKTSYGYEYFNANSMSFTDDVIVQQNTFTGIGRGIGRSRGTTVGRCFRLSSTNPQTSNIVIRNNICNDATENNINFASGGGTAWNGTLPSFNYNLYAGSPRDKFANWNATDIEFSVLQALGQEVTGQNVSSINWTPNSYKPNGTSSVACTMSSTGSYVGAFPCTTELTTTLNLANVGNKSVTNDTIILNWTNPSYTTFNHTEVWRNGSNVGNTTQPLSQYTDALLQPETGYYYVLRPIDHYGNYGENSTILLTTFITNASGGVWNGTSSGITLNSSEYTINLSFLQRPYFLYFNISENNTNIITANQPLSQTIECETGILSCNDANDGTVTQAIIDGGFSATLLNITKVFINHFSEIDGVILNYTYETDTGNIRTYCKNLTSYVYLGLHDHAGALTKYNWNISLKDDAPSCLEDDNITILFRVYKGGGATNFGFEDAGLISNSTYYVKFEDDYIFASGYPLNNTQFFNVTSNANANTDENITITLGTYGVTTFGFNLSYSYLYNKTINLSVLDIRDNSSINPLCVMNGISYHPATEFVYFNSSEDNYMECSLLGYGFVSTYLTPLYDNVTLYMGGFGLNITFKNEETDNIITPNNMFAYIIQGDYAANYTTTNGSISINYLAMPPGIFEIRYGGESYATRSYFVSLTGETTLELYDVLLNESSLIVFNVIDESGQPVTDALLKVQRYFIATGSYKLIGMEQIDDTGNAGMYLIPNTVPYIITVEKDANIIFMSSANKIFLDAVQIHAKLLDNPMESYYKLNQKLTTYLSFDNSTKVVSYFWNDASGIVREACVEVTFKGNTGTGTIGSTCSSASSGTLLLSLAGLIQSNTEYTAHGTVKTTTTFSDKETDTLSIFEGGGLLEAMGKPGLFFAYLLIITLFFIGLVFDFGVAIVYTTISLLIVNVIGIGYFPQALIVAISIVGLLIAMVSKRT